MRLRRRLTANDEIRRLCEEFTKRYWDAVSLGRALLPTTFEEVWDIAGMSRRDLFALCGNFGRGTTKRDLEGVVEY